MNLFDLQGIYCGFFVSAESESEVTPDIETRRMSQPLHELAIRLGAEINQGVGMAAKRHRVDPPVSAPVTRTSLAAGLFPGLSILERFPIEGQQQAPRLRLQLRYTWRVHQPRPLHLVR